MRKNPDFANMSLSFWAEVRFISQGVGYTNKANRKKNLESSVKIPSESEIKHIYALHKLSTDHLFAKTGVTTEGNQLIKYFQYRAQVLNYIAKTNLMTKDEAEKHYNILINDGGLYIPAPNNKQSENKKNPNYFTGIINTLFARNLGEKAFNSAPRSLITIRDNDRIKFCLSRWVDGAYPDVINPKAIWEIKEYYYTSTFGSRVADGVYETQLDGFELQTTLTELGCKIEHILFVDAKETWWDKGKSYLCRLVDSLHMDHIDCLVFGKECFSEIPNICRSLKVSNS